MSLHGGHRQRLRERFLNNGTKGMAEHEILELLLTYAIPRRDVNPLAHELINKFGSLRGVLDATPDELERVEGCGESSAALLSLVREMARLLEQPDLKNTRLTTPEKAGEYMRALLRGVRNECVYGLYLSGSFRLLGEKKVAEGTVDQTVVYPRRVAEQALSLGAASVILAHNHPGAGLKPGRADLDATEKVRKALATVGVSLVEHYIVSERGIYGILSGKTVMDAETGDAH